MNNKINFAYSGSSSYLFVNGVRFYRFDTKDSEIKTYGLCLGNILKDFTVDSVKAFIKCVSIKNQQCMVKPMLIDLNLEKLRYYPFISIVDVTGAVMLLKIYLVEYVFTIKMEYVNLNV